MSNTAEFRFYEELNDFLPPGLKKQSFPYSFNGCPAIKDSIEAIGVPHTEVDLILVNGNSVGFDYQLQSGDRVSVYPVFESLDISPIVKLRDRPLRDTKFIIDVHLGKLAKLLRMFGFDSVYSNSLSDPEIIIRSVNENRIIITRDIGILKNKSVTHGYWVRSTFPEKQVQEVIKRFDLKNRVRPFHRCINCNGILQPVQKSDILEKLQPKTIKYYHEFYRCSNCGNIYWKGSHYIKMMEKIKELLRE
ncbi:Mut7-C ubiquitin/RNAse domain-containing protein [candidate division KSB1 bacterium]|nr:Mut7-C ubiquitin/RNAse domain-containing protein [candidate division KSB1 bacterium]